MPELVLSSTAPVFAVDGQTRGGLGRDLVRLAVDHSTAGLASLEATFLAAGSAGDSPGLLTGLDVDPIALGARLRVSIGQPGSERTVFEGTVSAVEARFDHRRAPRLVLLAEDALMALRATVRSRTFEDATDDDIVQRIASDHGLRATVDADGPTYAVVQQWNQSDLGFLRDRAARLGAEVWADGDTVHVATRDRRQGTDVTLVQGSDLVVLDVRADLAEQRTTVAVAGYDVNDRARIHEQAGADAVRSETSGGRLGPDVLSDTAGDVGVVRTHDVPLTAAEARAWARAEQLRRGRRFVTAVGVTNGTPDLVVGSRVTLERVGRPFEGGGYYATRVRHTYDLTDGHRTEVHLERAAVEVR